MGYSVLKKTKKIDYVWPRHIRKQISNNLHYILFIKAKPGRGKSFTGLSIATLTDDTFVRDIVKYGIRNRVSDNLRDFAHMIARKDAPRGTVFMLEEGSVNLNSKDAMRNAQRSIENILTVARFKGYFIIINAPYIESFFKAGRMLVDATFEVVARKKNWNIIKAKEIEYVSGEEQPRNSFLKVLMPNHKMQKLTRLWLPKPPAAVLAQYKVFESDFKQRIIEDECERLDKQSMEPSPKLPNTMCKRCQHKWRRTTTTLPSGCPMCKLRKHEEDIIDYTQEVPDAK